MSQKISNVSLMFLGCICLLAQAVQQARTLSIGVIAPSSQILDRERHIIEWLKKNDPSVDIEPTWVTSYADEFNTTGQLTLSWGKARFKALISTSKTCSNEAHFASAMSLPYFALDCSEDFERTKYPFQTLMAPSLFAHAPEVTRYLLFKGVSQFQVFLPMSKSKLGDSMALEELLQSLANQRLSNPSLDFIPVRYFIEGDIPEFPRIPFEYDTRCGCVFVGTKILFSSFLQSLQDDIISKGCLVVFLTNTVMGEFPEVPPAYRVQDSDFNMNTSYELSIISPEVDSIRYKHPADMKDMNVTSDGLFYDTMNLYITAVSQVDQPRSGRKILNFITQNCHQSSGGTTFCFTADGHRREVMSVFSFPGCHGDNEWHMSASFSNVDDDGELAVEVKECLPRIVMTPYPRDFGGNLHEEEGPSGSQLVILLVCLISSSLLTCLVLLVWCRQYVRRKVSKQRRKSWQISLHDIKFFQDFAEGEKEDSMFESPFVESQEVTRGVTTEFGYYKEQPVSIKKFSSPAFIVQGETCRQLEALSSLHHDNLGTFYGLCINSQEVIIVNEYCIKGSLEEIMMSETINPDNMLLASLIADLIKGLCFLHKSSTGCHGNLKSSNCLVTGRWVLKLTDFGLLNLRHSYRSDRGLLWCAPEVIRTKSCSSEKSSDIYSFAVILYELVGKQGPFGIGYDMAESEIKEIIHNVVELGSHPDVSTLACEDFVKNCMVACWQENPKARPDMDAVESIIRPLKSPLKGRSIVDNMLSMMERYQLRLEDLVEERTSQLAVEKKKTEALLHRMLPSQVADQLLSGQSVEPEAYSCITVFFSDICGFTALAARKTPMEVIDLLNNLYIVFDTVLSRYDVYKVETVGDEYLVVSGLPVPNGDKHAAEIAYMALDFRNALKNFKVDHNDYEGHLQIRIGIHSGPCVAGVVGLSMPRYTLFGDTVNTASRLETTGEAMKIQCSGTTKDLLDKVGGFYMERRGLVNLKGKGEMETYWLTGNDLTISTSSPCHSPLPSHQPTSISTLGLLRIPSELCPLKSRAVAKLGHSLEEDDSELTRTWSTKSQHSVKSAPVFHRAGSFRKRQIQSETYSETMGDRREVSTPLLVTIKDHLMAGNLQGV